MSFAIAGAGTFGLSTALELARKGHKNITCYDKFPVPSPIAAGNDSNKIMDYPYIAPDETPTTDERLTLEALEAWKTDVVFKPHFHQVGFIVCACKDEPLTADTERVKYLREKGLKQYEFLSKPEEFRKHLPVLTGDLPDWKGYVLDEDNGWVHARDALKSAFAECERLGVKFVFGDDGEIIETLKQGDKVTGLKSKSGKVHVADKYVISMGANAVTALDFKGQLEGKCFTLAHIKVSDEEAEKFKGLPVIFNCDRGFFFEADENNEIKIVNEFPGYTRYTEGESVPFYSSEIPKEAADGIRQYLEETMPYFKDREFVQTRLCWCTDSPNRELILCTHPELKNLTIASGDSGKSFALMPIIGKYIATVASEGETALNLNDRESWKWRPETAAKRDKKQGRWGGREVVTDLKDYTEWVSAENPTPHRLEYLSK